MKVLGRCLFAKVSMLQKEDSRKLFVFRTKSSFERKFEMSLRAKDFNERKKNA